MIACRRGTVTGVPVAESGGLELEDMVAGDKLRKRRKLRNVGVWFGTLLRQTVEQRLRASERVESSRPVPGCCADIEEGKSVTKNDASPTPAHVLSHMRDPAHTPY